MHNSVFFQAFLTSRGPAIRCVDAVLDHRIVLLASRDTLAEAREVLARPFVREWFPHATDERIETFLSELAYLSEFWRNVPRVLECERDPDDEPYLNLAAAASATHLVTRDKDLLTLPTAHSEDARRFRQVTRNQVQIVTPDGLLEQLGK